ncbi:MAG: MarR family transcriptional regulator, partial [Phycisphaerales bacterium]|nr:MarR family transcriptional regulator [Phycisphaerales bacterium]
MASVPDAGLRAMNALRRLVSALRSSGAAASAMEGMSVAQQFALRVIASRPGVTMSQLAAATLTTPSAVSEVVARLVARGAVRREPDAADHRQVLVHLTPEGRALCDRVAETLPERLVAALAAMEPAARASLADAMEAWVARAGLGDVPPSMFGEGPERSGGGARIP